MKIFGVYATRLSCLSLSFLALASCDSPADKARQRYEFLKQQHASRGEVCDAGQEMVKAYADARSPQYKEVSAIAGLDCLNAEMTGREQTYGEPDIQADNMDAIAE
jgi:hypothetical protein